MEDFISVREFCDIFGVSRQSVQKKIVAKQISAIKFGNKYLIPRCEIERIREQGTN